MDSLSKVRVSHCRGGWSGRLDSPGGAHFTRVGFQPRFHMTIDGAGSEGGGQPLRTSGFRKTCHQEQGTRGTQQNEGWRLRGRPVIKAVDEPCSFCGRALDESIDGLGSMSAPIQVSRSHGGRVNSRCMLECVDRVNLAYADLRP